MRSRLVVVVAITSFAVLAGCGGGDDAAEPSERIELSAAALEGEALAREQGCMSCHAVDDGPSMGPSWAGLAGSEIELESGETVTADRAYLREAIVDPRSQVRAGYANIMPNTYDLTDEEVDALLVFLEELGEASDD